MWKLNFFLICGPTIYDFKILPHGREVGPPLAWSVLAALINITHIKSGPKWPKNNTLDTFNKVKYE